MPKINRRSFLKTSALATVGAAFSARSWSQVAGANGDIRVAIAGLNGRGKELAVQFPQISGVRVVALCDCDTAILDREMAAAKARGHSPVAVVDYRELLPRADIDAIAICTNFHYDWHWQWATGNGDMVAQGNHQLDVGRRLLGDPGHPVRVFTVGGRFGYEDDGETPNTFLIHYDYGAGWAPFIVEVRGLPAKPDELSGNAAGKGGLGSAALLAASMDKFLGLNVGNIAHCESGYLAIPASNYSLAQAFDRDGKLLKEFRGAGNHHANFIDAMRSRKESDLNCPPLEGHRSSALVHLANISYRVGCTMAPGDIRDQLKGRGAELAEPFARMQEHLAANNVDLAKLPATLGAPLTFEVATEKFTGENSAAANQHHSREYRAPWSVPRLA